MKFVNADYLDRAIKELHDKVATWSTEHPHAGSSVYNAYDAGYLKALETMREFIKALPEKEGHP